MQDKNKTQLYIQLSRHNEVQEGPVRLTDVAKVYGLGTEEKKKLDAVELLCIKKGAFGRYSLSAGEIADKLLEKYPRYDPVFLGDPEIVLEYPRPQSSPGIRDWVWTAFVSTVIFVGSAFTIMTFIRESDLDDLFAGIYDHLGMANAADMHGIEIGFAIGMGVGMLLYFNHFGHFRLQNEPTPMEMEMHQYMEDAEETVLETGDTKGEDE